MRDEYDFSKMERVDSDQSKKYKFELAETDRTDDYWEEIDRILGIIGYPEALVTDLSSFGDFILNDYECKKLSEKLGVEITGDKLLVDAAEELHKKEK